MIERKYLSVMLMLACVCASAQTPSHLATELIEETEAVYSGGYRTNVDLREIDAVKGPLQFAEIRNATPAFSWRMESDRDGAAQSAYRILVATDEKLLSEGSADIWDSGKVDSSRSTGIRLQDKELDAGKLYFWTVRIWDDEGHESGWAPAKAFRTAEVLDGTPSRYPLVKESGIATSMSKPAGGCWLFDFGKDAWSQINLRLTSAAGGDTVTVHLGEAVKDGRIDRNPGGSIRYCSYTLPLKKGTHLYKIAFRSDKRNSTIVEGRDHNPVLVPDYIGEIYPFRYCEIEGLDIAPAIGDAIRETVSYKFDDAAAGFSCNDRTLNAVWELCKHSIKATSALGVYIDGDRERIPYEADALINQLSHYYCDDEYSIARYTVDYLCRHATWPTEWILQALIMAWNDYMYTGDSWLLERDYEILKARTLIALKEDNGLISTRTGKQTPELMKSIGYAGKAVKDIVDWPQAGAAGLEKENAGEADGFEFSDYNTVVNAFHYKALTLMAGIAGELGKTADQAEFGRCAQQHKEAFNRLLYDRKAGAYRDGIGVQHHSLHSSMMALAFGLVPDKETGKVLAFIRSRGMACSVYGAQFLLDALYRSGDGGYALELLRSKSIRSWYNMLKCGTTITFEAWDNSFKPNQDWNHAWGSAPANAIPAGLMGIRPVEPGWKKVQIRPQTGDLEDGQVTVPTILGDVSLSFAKKAGSYSMEVDIPANMEAEILLPRANRKSTLTVDGQTASIIRTGSLTKIETESGKHTITINEL